VVTRSFRLILYSGYQVGQDQARAALRLMEVAEAAIHLGRA
jgi:hypothetical protein